MIDDCPHPRSIISSNRDRSGVALSLSCGHTVLRHPAYQIPLRLEADCDSCAVEHYQETVARTAPAASTNGVPSPP